MRVLYLLFIFMFFKWHFFKWKQFNLLLLHFQLKIALIKQHHFTNSKPLTSIELTSLSVSFKKDTETQSEGKKSVKRSHGIDIWNLFYKKLKLCLVIGIYVTETSEFNEVYVYIITPWEIVKQNTPIFQEKVMTQTTHKIIPTRTKCANYTFNYNK